MKEMKPKANELEHGIPALFLSLPYTRPVITRVYHKTNGGDSEFFINFLMNPNDYIFMVVWAVVVAQELVR
jgi:hypothetical protein